MNIVLFNPEIPNNTGNIGRTCVLTNSTLHLIKPLGFSMEDKYIRRAGMDYWSSVKLKIYESFDEFVEKNKDGKFYFATTKADKYYSEVEYGMNDYIILGRESKGIDENILKDYKDTCIKIPMIPMGRSLNLANASAVILFEALKQNGFDFGE